MSIIDDYAGIARALREKQGLPKPKSVRNERQQAAQNQLGIQAPDPGHSHQYSQGNRPWGGGQQAQQAVGPIGSLPCSLCDDEGWIGVRRKGMWRGYQCPVCGNPRHNPNLLP